MYRPKNRIAEYLDGTENADIGVSNRGASMPAQLKTSKNSVSTTAELIVRAIEERWDGLDQELAAAARISTSGLTLLKTKGATEPTKNLRKLCRVLGVDVRKLLAGHLVYVQRATGDRRPDLHGMLSQLVGTTDEPTIERVLRAMIESRQH